MMSRIIAKTLLALLIAVNIGWISESGSGVVSDSEVISRTSLEATEVLTSGLLSNLYGSTHLGGTVNHASFDAGGILHLDNIVASDDVIKLGNNDFLSWKRNGEGYISVGVSSSQAFVVTASIDVVSGTIMNSRNDSFGWSLVEADNQACTTTCTHSAVIGYDRGANTITGTTATSSDVCLCAGNS